MEKGNTVVVTMRSVRKGIPKDVLETCVICVWVPDDMKAAKNRKKLVPFKDRHIMIDKNHNFTIQFMIT